MTFLSIIISILIINFNRYFQDVLALNFGINSNESSPRVIRYLFYDVNPPEGFNLRRDVYIRMTALVNDLQKKENWVLVLPPWPRLYHWRSPIAQEKLPWSHFFDLASLQKHAPVIEMMDFLDMNPSGIIDQVYILQHFEDMFTSGKFEDKLELRQCENIGRYTRRPDGLYIGSFWGMAEMSTKRVDCLSFHGHASLLSPFLQNSTQKTVFIDHAEVPLHDRYGDETFWRARRSMKFSKRLQEVANKFREQYLNSTDHGDNTFTMDDWTLQKAHRRAVGGPYLAVHLRRRDFLQARVSEIPSLRSAASQIKTELNVLKLQTVFVATDAPSHELDQLEELLAIEEISMVAYRPAFSEIEIIKDGGVAIVEQIICSHARKFIGTHESTYSLRIQEEREILGFPPETTFNRLCGTNHSSCQQPSRWLIRY